MLLNTVRENPIRSELLASASSMAAVRPVMQNTSAVWNKAQVERVRSTTGWVIVSQMKCGREDWDARSAAVMSTSGERWLVLLGRTSMRSARLLKVLTCLVIGWTGILKLLAASFVSSAAR